MMTASQKQIQANRRNAQMRTGPTTVEGKNASSNNAVKFGLYAKRIPLPGENESEYLELLQAYFDHEDPQNAVQDLQVREIVDIRWKLERLSKAEQRLSSAPGPYRSGPPRI